MKKITVSDFTLRAVEQLNLSLTFREKLLIAEKLDLSGVDSIELPALIGSKENEVIYRTISSAVKNCIVKIPVGMSEESLNFAYECVKSAKNFCLQVVLPVSTALMTYSCQMKSPALIAKIEELCKLAKKYTDNIEFVALDVFRAEEGFVELCAKTAYESGAKTIALCDDNGEALFTDYENIVASIKSVCDIRVEVQPSNELNMASSSAVTAIKAGADGVKTSCVGKYLSLANLSDIVRSKKYCLEIETNVNQANVHTIESIITGTSDKNEEIETDTPISKTIENTATIKDISSAIKQLGYELTDSDIGKVYEEFKKLTVKKDAIDSKELEAVIASTAMQVPSTYHLVNFFVNSGNVMPATANITLEKDGEKFTGVSTGDGPIDAAFHAIEQIIGHHYELDDFQVHAVTKGRGAVGSSIIRLRANGRLYPGNGVSTDIIGACIRAYVNALNKIVYEEN